MSGSWQPKAAGALGGIAALALAAQLALQTTPTGMPTVIAPAGDVEPSQTADWTLIAALLANAWGIFVSRQNNVRSESVGAK